VHENLLRIVRHSLMGDKKRGGRVSIQMHSEK
jgi:hypothetical protein